jgi:hypothetical protein
MSAVDPQASPVPIRTHALGVEAPQLPDVGWLTGPRRAPNQMLGCVLGRGSACVAHLGDRDPRFPLSMPSDGRGRDREDG